VPIENFTHPKKAKEDNYPEKSFGYSPILPIVINFDRPVQLSQMWLK
jgi:hypothetical protein